MIQKIAKAALLALALSAAAAPRFPHEPSSARVTFKEASIRSSRFKQPELPDSGTSDERSDRGAASSYFPYPSFAPVGASVSSSNFSLRQWIDETIDFERTSELYEQKGDIDR